MNAPTSRTLGQWLQRFAVAIALALVATQPLAATVRYVYDEIGRLTAAIDPDGDTLEYAYDDVGNLLSVTRRSTIAVSIVSFSPASGFVGQQVTLVGTGFDAAPASNTVRFNGAAAVVTASTPTQITTSVPAGATTGPISVSNSRGSATSATPFTVTLPQPPVIASFAPIVASPGNAVTITGANFAAPASANGVRINDVAATVQSAAPDTIVFTTPLAAGGPIRVTTAAGSATSAGDFFIAPPPHAAADVGFTGRVALNAAPASVVLAATKVALLLVNASAGDAGLRVAVRDATFAFGARLSVFRPDGTLLAASTSTFGASGSLALPALPAGGTYTIVLVPDSGRSGNASVSVVRDATGTLAVDTPFDFVVATQGQQGRFTFQGTAGATLSLVLDNVTLPSGGTVSVTQPNGSALLSPTAFGATGAGIRLTTLPAGGTYTVEIVPNAGTGQVRITIKAIDDIDAGELVIDQPRTLAFAAAGQVARARFTGAAGDSLGISIAQVTLTGGTFRVLRPDGGQLLSPSSFAATGTGFKLPALPVAGVYTVEVTAGGTQAGSIALTVWRDVDGGTLVANGPERSFAVAFNGQILRFRFEGTGGVVHGLRLANVTSTAGMNFQLRRANGSLLQNFSVGNTPTSFSMGTLPATETYTMEVYPINGGTASFDAALWTNVDGGGAGYDETRELTITNPGQFGKFTFTGTTGDLAGFRLVPDMPVNVLVRRPDTAVILNTSFGTGGASVRLGALTATGTYTVEIFPINSGTGTVRFTPWKDVEATMLVDAAQATPFTITHAGQQARLRFDAQANTLAGLQATLAGSAASVLVRRPDGAVIINTSLGIGTSSFRLGALTQGGTHLVEFIPINSGTGTFAMKVWIDVAGTIAFDQSRDISLPNAGQQAKFTFDGASGDTAGLHFGNITLGAGFTLLVRRPDGALILNTSLGTAGGSVRVGTLTQNGPHTVEIIPINSATGSLRMSLWKDIEAQVVPDAAPTPITIPFQAQQVRLRFTGAIGMNSGLAIGSALMSNGMTLLLRRPDGALILNTTLGPAGGSVRFPVLTQDGTHLIELIPINSGTASFTARVWLDPAVTLAYGEARDISLPNAGQQARITFNAAIGDNPGLDLSAMKLGAVTLLVRRPDGALVLNTTIGPAGGSVRFPTITQNGLHLVEVIPINSATGTFRATLWRDVAVTLAYGESADVTVAFAGQQAKATFVGAIGDGAGFAIAPIAGSVPTTQILARRPDGALILSTSFGSTGGSVRIGALTQAGPHLVEVIPGSPLTGSFRVTAWRDPIVPLPLATPASVAVGFVGQQGVFLFDAPANFPARLTFSDVTFGTSSLLVLNPSGAVMLSTTLGSAGGIVDLTMSAAGIHRIVLSPSATGSATLRVDSR